MRAPSADTPDETGPKDPQANGSEPPPTTGNAAADAAARTARSAFGAAVRNLSERRGLRVALIGIGLVLLSVWLGESSALSVPLLVFGIVLIVMGAVGPRLQGRIVVDFGPDGSLFEVRTHLAPPGRHALPAAMPERTHVTTTPEPDPPDAEVIEAHGETIEFDAEQLKRLLDEDETARPRPA